MEKQNIIDKLENFDVSTKKILKDLSHISNEKLKEKSGNGWSILQVFSHLNEAEEASLNYMKKKVQAGDKMEAMGFLNNVRMKLTNMALSSSLKWKAPSYISSPHEPVSLEEIENQWLKTRKSIADFVADYPEEYLNKLVYKHPMGGRQDLSNAVDSFIYHQAHHLHQIKRIKKKLAIS